MYRTMHYLWYYVLRWGDAKVTIQCNPPAKHKRVANAAEAHVNVIYNFLSNRNKTTTQKKQNIKKS